MLPRASARCRARRRAARAPCGASSASEGATARRRGARSRRHITRAARRQCDCGRGSSRHRRPRRRSRPACLRKRRTLPPSSSASARSSAPLLRALLDEVVPAAVRQLMLPATPHTISRSPRASSRHRAGAGIRPRSPRSRPPRAACIGSASRPGGRHQTSGPARRARVRPAAAAAAAVGGPAGGVVVSARITIGARAPWRHARSSPAPRRARSPCRA